MTRLNYAVMCLLLLTSLGGCYATVGHPRHARHEVIVYDDRHHHHDRYYEHRDHWHH